LAGCLVFFPGPGLAPAGDSLSFASPKESKQRKGDSTVCDPFAALRGNLRCSRFAGSRRTRFAQTAASPYPRNAALLGAARGGGSGHRCARPSKPFGSSLCSASVKDPGPTHAHSPHKDAPRRVDPDPLWLCRGAQEKAGSGPQLSERNEVERVLRTPAFSEHRRLPVAKRRDTDSGVAFSLVTFSWRDKRK